MKCPACNLTLTRRPVGDLEVDVCRGGCGGLWFDNYELDKVDEQHEHVGEELLQIEGDPSAHVDHERERSCPRCSGTRLMCHFWSVKLQVEVDECPKCGGTWLDTGELASIRGAFPNEEARRQAAKKHFDTLFGEELKRMRAESGEKARKAHRFAHMFRFICPTWYIPGKQDWGAF